MLLAEQASLVGSLFVVVMGRAVGTSQCYGVTIFLLHICMNCFPIYSCCKQCCHSLLLAKLTTDSMCKTVVMIAEVVIYLQHFGVLPDAPDEVLVRNF